jgi:hypothetical protein
MTGLPRGTSISISCEYFGSGNAINLNLIISEKTYRLTVLRLFDQMQIAVHFQLGEANDLVDDSQWHWDVVVAHPVNPVTQFYHLDVAGSKRFQALECKFGGCFYKRCIDHGRY